MSALTVRELRDRMRDASAAGGPFTLSYEDLGLDYAQGFFDTYLDGDDLIVQAPFTFDADALSLSGTTRLGEVGAVPAVDVVFTADPGDELVTGLRVAATLGSWEINTSYLTVSLSGFEDAYGFDGAVLVLGAGPDPDGAAGSWASAGLAFSVRAQRACFLVSAPDEDGEFELSGAFASGLGLPELAALAELPAMEGVGGQDLTLPPGIPLGSGLGTVSVHCGINPKSGGVRWMWLRAELAGVDWPVVPDLLGLAGLSVTYGIGRDDPGLGLESRPLVSVELGASLDVAGNRLSAAISVPDLVLTAQLDRPGRADGLLGTHLDGSGIADEVQISHLRVVAGLRDKSYTLSLGLDTTWEFFDTITVEAVALELSGVAAAPDTVTVSGALTVGGVLARLEAHRDRATGWTMSVRTGGSLRTADLARWLDDTFSVPLPAALADAEVREMALAFEPATSTLSLSCAAAFAIGDTGAALTLRARISRVAGVYSAGFWGELLVSAGVVDGQDQWMAFRLALDHDPAGTAFTASWQAADEDAGVPLLGLLAGLGLEGMDELRELLPPALCPSLRSVSITYDGRSRSTVVAAEFGESVVVYASVPDPSAPTRSVALLQVGVNVRAGLTDLPLLADMVPAGADLRLSRVRGVYASREVSTELVKRVNELVTAAGSSLPPFPQLSAGQGPAGVGLRQGAVLVVDYELPGSAPASLIVPLSRAGNPGQTGSRALPDARWGTGGPEPVPDGTDAGGSAVAAAGDGVLEGVVWPAGGAVPGPHSPAGDNGVPVASAGSGAPGAWLDVGRSFGPLHVARIGLAYDQGAVWLMVDGALSGAGLTMSVAGLGLGIDLSGEDSFPVRTRLQGLGVGFERPPLHVSGALVSRPTAEWPVLVQGTLTVELTPKLSVLAVGAYQKRPDGAVSLFVFGRAAAPFGGPPPFVVTGFALGFGYQSSVRIPEQHEIGSFPLVKGLDDGLPADPLQVLAQLTEGDAPWVRPAEGQIWLAGGLDFTSFEFVRSRVLLLLEAGRDLTLALIGTSEARFPKAGRAYAQVRVELRVVYRSARGELAATAMLVNSYVIDEACALTGGFAFFLWFGPSDYAGDFVLTVGGYHPDYTPLLPPHYPRVPRLGFTWSISGTVTISGGCYFALTPRAIMAGGALDVRYKSGNTEAWLTAWLDVWIQWAPVYFTASIGVRIGAKTKLLFWIHAELGAEVRLWGPPTGGEVTLRFAFLKITIGFGTSRALPPALDWGRFAAELLPAQSPLQVLAVEGLLAATDQDPAARRDPQAEPWRVDPAGFSFKVTTVVPVTHVTWDDQPVTNGLPDPAEPLHIRPMDRREVVSRLDVTVAYTSDGRRAGAIWGQAPGVEDWVPRVEQGRVPFSLWGDPDPKATGELLGHGTGLEVRVPAPKTEGQTYAPIAEADLKLEDVGEPTRNLPLDPAAGPTGPLPSRPPARGAGVGAVARGIAATATVAARAGLHEALRDLLAPGAPIDDPFALVDGDLAGYAAHVAEIGLDADPLLVPTP